MPAPSWSAVVGSAQLTRLLVPCAPQEKNDEEWQKLGGLQGVAAALHTSLHDGVDATAEAGGKAGPSLQQRRAAFGANRFKQIPPKSLFKLWVSNLKDPTLIMLMIAALVGGGDAAAAPGVDLLLRCPISARCCMLRMD